MLEIIGALTGFIGSTVPSVLSYFGDRSNKKQELIIRRSEAENGAKISSDKADMSETQEIYKTFYSGNKFIDFYNASVRPTITYFIFSMYVCSKFDIIANWTPNDDVLLMIIVGFYFGQRSVQKIMNFYKK